MMTTERIEENTGLALRLEVETLRNNRVALELTNRELTITVKLFDELLGRLELGLALEVGENDKRAARGMRAADKALETSGRLNDLEKDYAGLIEEIERFEAGESFVETLKRHEAEKTELEESLEKAKAACYRALERKRELAKWKCAHELEIVNWQVWASQMPITKTEEKEK